MSHFNNVVPPREFGISRLQFFGLSHGDVLNINVKAEGS
jgi:hypothetical protein